LDFSAVLDFGNRHRLIPCGQVMGCRKAADGRPPACVAEGLASVGQTLPLAFQLAISAAMPLRNKGRTMDRREKQRRCAGMGAIRAFDKTVTEIEGHYCLLLLKRLAQAREANAISDRRDEHR